MSLVKLVPSGDAFNGADVVQVDEGSEAFELWTGRGYVVEGSAPKTKPKQSKKERKLSGFRRSSHE